MNKRLRKKKRVGEFQELGFDVRLRLRGGDTGEAVEAFEDRWTDLLEARGLALGGGLRGSFVTRPGRRSATEEDRAALAGFLAADVEVLDFEVGALRDAWA